MITMEKICQGNYILWLNDIRIGFIQVSKNQIYDIDINPRYDKYIKDIKKHMTLSTFQC